MRLKYILVGLIFFVWGQVHAQNTSVDNLNKASFEDFRSKHPYIFLTKDQVHRQANLKNVPIYLELEGGDVAELQYFDELGDPVYYQIFNVRAAKITGTSALQPNGELNLNLTGKGMTVGIYDQTRPKPDHVEFSGRLTQIDGSTETISNHATHVSGTVLAAGINPAARGMAYEATGWSFNWESDLSKMNANAYDPVSKPNGHLVSNHSYGLVVGWYRNSSGNWTWAGNTSISTSKDYRFGFYGAKSKGLDDLTVSKPYYTIVWAAGNDRNDTGDGTRDPDGPEDTIGPEGVAKNVITVGAVSANDEYSGPQSVFMSDFSSWGPTDDGRIKPDLVGVGVNVFSSAISNGGTTDSYASLSGTSMAAPNVTGSLLLLQQLYSDRNSGRFMRSSTLKALAINTTREAGSAAGPDYVYGWGLLNTHAAAEIILNENGNSDIIREEVLTNGGEFEYEFLSDGVTPIRLTVAWIDPSGNPVSPSLNPANLMLINDLDVRVIDEQGNTFFPWSLNPQSGPNGPAVRDRDNFRDNVEQIQIDAPKAQRYRLKITHKGSLQGGQQAFSLVFKAGVADGASETLYWIGQSGSEWNDPKNWSFVPNGVSAGKIPSNQTRVVFESSTGQNQTVNLNGDATVFSVNLFGNQMVNFDLNQNTLQVESGFRVSNQITQITNGTIRFVNASSNQQLVELGEAIFDDVKLDFEDGSWKILSAGILGDVAVSNATLDFDFAHVRLRSLSVNNGGEVSGVFTKLTFLEGFSLTANSMFKPSIQLAFEGEQGTYSNQIPDLNLALTVLSGVLDWENGDLNRLDIDGARVNASQISKRTGLLNMGPGAHLSLNSGGNLNITDSMAVSATTDKKAQLTATSNATLLHDIYRKYCFDHLDVSGVNLEGDAIINLGTASALQNAMGWLQQDCEDVLFANFEFGSACVGGAAFFKNLSEGDITTYSWNFAGLGSSTLTEPVFVFPNAGKFNVNLTISNSLGSVSFEREITVSENSIAKPTIVLNGNQLTSQQPGSSYQWFRNGLPIVGATQRSFTADDDGSYQVAIFDASCNRLSDALVISAISEPDLAKFGVFVGPIPSEDLVTIQIQNEFEGSILFRLIDLSGRTMLSKIATKNSEELIETLPLPNQTGVYILQIETNDLTLHKKVIKF